MKFLSKVLFFLFSLVIFSFLNADPYYEPMEFHEGWSGGNALEALWIVAIGVIKEDTPEKFKEFISNNKPAGIKIVLHSPGGDLVAGIQLGREIRKLELDTFVGNSIDNSENRIPSGNMIYNDFAPGKCLSACAYAFLGGVDRNLLNDDEYHNWGGFYSGMFNSELGFHQFYNDSKITENITAK